MLQSTQKCVILLVIPSRYDVRNYRNVHKICLYRITTIGFKNSIYIQHH